MCAAQIENSPEEKIMMERHKGGNKTDLKPWNPWPISSILAMCIDKTLLYFQPKVIFQMVFKGLNRIQNFRRLINRRLGRRERLLAWLNETLKNRTILDIQTIWNDGSILCSLIDTLIPGLLIGDDMSLRHGQSIAFQYLGVPPAFTEEELRNETFFPHLERRLVRYLSSLQSALARHPPLQRCSLSLDSAPPMPNCLARGMGLITAAQYDRAHFYLYLLDANLGLGDVFVELQSKDDFGFARIGQKNSSTALRKFSNIPVSFAINSNSLRINYTPQSSGLHQLSIMRKGFHIQGSPFSVPVEKNDAKQTFKTNNRDRKRTPQKRLRVLFRIVDFVTEKMVLTEEGKLKKMSSNEYLQFERHTNECRSDKSSTEKPGKRSPDCCQGGEIISKDQATSMPDMWGSFSDGPDSLGDVPDHTLSSRVLQEGNDPLSTTEHGGLRLDSDRCLHTAITEDVSSSPSVESAPDLQSTYLDIGAHKNYKTRELPSNTNKNKLLYRQDSFSSPCTSPKRNQNDQNMNKEGSKAQSNDSSKNYDFKTRCKKIVAACHFIMSHSSQHRFDLLKTVGHVFDGRPVKLSEDIEEILMNIPSISIEYDDHESNLALAPPVMVEEELRCLDNQAPTSETDVINLQGEKLEAVLRSEADNVERSFITVVSEDTERNSIAQETRDGDLISVQACEEKIPKQETNNIREARYETSTESLEMSQPMQDEDFEEILENSEKTGSEYDTNECSEQHLRPLYPPGQIFDEDIDEIEQMFEKLCKEHDVVKEINDNSSTDQKTENNNLIFIDDMFDGKSEIELEFYTPENLNYPNQDLSSFLDSLEISGKLDEASNIDAVRPCEYDPSIHDQSETVFESNDFFEGGNEGLYLSPQEHLSIIDDDFYSVGGPALSSSPSCVNTDDVTGFSDIEPFLSKNFTEYMMSETQFHLWPSDVAFGEERIDPEDDLVDFDAVISAPNLEEALLKLEKDLKSKKTRTNEEIEECHTGEGLQSSFTDDQISTHGEKSQEKDESKLISFEEELIDPTFSEMKEDNELLVPMNEEAQLDKDRENIGCSTSVVSSQVDNCSGTKTPIKQINDDSTIETTCESAGCYDNVPKVLNAYSDSIEIKPLIPERLSLSSLHKRREDISLAPSVLDGNNPSSNEVESLYGGASSISNLKHVHEMREFSAHEKEWSGAGRSEQLVGEEHCSTPSDSRSRSLDHEDGSEHHDDFPGNYESSHSSNEEACSPVPEGENAPYDLGDSAYLSIDDNQNSFRNSPENNSSSDDRNRCNKREQIKFVSENPDYDISQWQQDGNLAITGFMGPAERDILGMYDQDEVEDDASQLDWQPVTRYYPRVLTPLVAQMSAIVEEDDPGETSRIEPQVKPECQGNAILKPHYLPAITLTLSEDSLDIIDSKEVQTQPLNGEETEYYIAEKESKHRSSENVDETCEMLDEDGSSVFAGFGEELEPQIVDESDKSIIERDLVSSSSTDNNEPFNFKQDYDVNNKLDENSDFQNELSTERSAVNLENKKQIIEINDFVNKCNDETEVEECIDFNVMNEDVCAEAINGDVDSLSSKTHENHVENKEDAIESEKSEKEKSEDEIIKIIDQQSELFTEAPLELRDVEASTAEHDGSSEVDVSTTLTNLAGEAGTLLDGFPVTMKVEQRKQFWDQKLCSPIPPSGVKKSVALPTPSKVKKKSSKFVLADAKCRNEKIHIFDQIDTTLAGIVKKWRENFEKDILNQKPPVPSSEMADMGEEHRIEDTSVMSKKRQYWNNILEGKAPTSSSIVPVASPPPPACRSPSLHHARRVLVSEEDDEDDEESNSSQITEPLQEEDDWKLDLQKNIALRDLVSQRRSQQIISTATSARCHKINKEEIRSRFEKAKHFFQSLEHIKPSADNYAPVGDESGLRKRKPKHRKQSQIYSAPSSDSETAARTTKQIETAIGGGSERIKVSERFHVKDLFKDVIGDSEGENGSFMKGIPHKEAVLKSLRSVEVMRPFSPYEEADYCCPHDDDTMACSYPLQEHQTDYPYVPKTSPRHYKGRPSLQQNKDLIPRKKLIGMEQSYFV